MSLWKLVRLIEHLEGVLDEDFDICHWKRESACRTTACAGGHACTIFPELKLILSYSSSVKYYTIEYKGLREFDALARFFGISNKTTLHIFHQDYYDEPTRRNVIRRIQKYVRKKL